MLKNGEKSQNYREFVTKVQKPGKNCQKRRKTGKSRHNYPKIPKNVEKR